MLATWSRVWKAVAIPVLFIGPAALAQTKGAWVDPPADLSAPEAQARERSSTSPTHANLSPPSAASSPAPEDVAAPAAKPMPPVGVDQRKRQARSEQPSSAGLVKRNAVSTPQAASWNQTTQAAREIGPAPRSPSMAAVRQRSGAGRAIARERDARDLAVSYLSHWSEPNRQALHATPAFYGSGVVFHGKPMSFGALLAEKRRFVQRWPDREYRYRPETMGVKCEPNSTSCTIRSTFDFDAANSRIGRRSRGVGTHELVVSFAGSRPVIVSENSRVLGRGSGR
jgi:hypothetical protein